MAWDPAFDVAFTPASVAVLGASTKPRGGGNGFIRGMQEMGYEGRLYPVNPHAEKIMGYQCYPSLAAVPEVPDLVIMAVGVTRAEQALEECIAKGARNIHMFTAGFEETGDASGPRDGRAQRNGVDEREHEHAGGDKKRADADVEAAVVTLGGPPGASQPPANADYGRGGRDRQQHGQHHYAPFRHRLGTRHCESVLPPCPVSAPARVDWRAPGGLHAARAWEYTLDRYEPGGTGGGARTHKVLRPTDFKSAAYANSATPARRFGVRLARSPASIAAAISDAWMMPPAGLVAQPRPPADPPNGPLRHRAVRPKLRT